MANRRSSWPWRKKTSLNTNPSLISSTPTLPFNSLPSHSLLNSPVSSFKEGEAGSLADITFTKLVNNKTDKNDDGVRLVEETSLRKQAEEKVITVEEKLNLALAQISDKDARISQLQKAVDEAISGRETAEKEALLFKHELDATSQQKSILESRVTQLDGAFKECTRQVKAVKEEQEKKIQEAISSTTREWEKIKTEVDAKQSELDRRLMESEAQNSAMSKSLQDRAKKIIDANEAKTKAETEVELLQVKLSSCEKEISSLKYELHVLSKELDIRNEEVEFVKKSADAAHKQHLDNVKKMANLEADCTRLRNLVRKKLPGPAAIAQMRKEVDMLPGSREYNTMGDVKRKPKVSSPTSGYSSYSTNNREVEMLRERMLSMEEETKILKDALSKRNEELQASRLLCAKTASKLYLGDDIVDSPQGTPRSLTKTSSFRPVTPTKEPSVASASDEAEESSCAESWASALISELAHFKKGKVTDGSAGSSSDAVDPPNSVTIPISISRLDMVLSKIISFLEMWPRPLISVEESKGSVDGDVSKKEEAPSISQSDLLKQALVSSKDKFLLGESSIFEYVLRLATLLCEKCNAKEEKELEELLAKLDATSSEVRPSMIQMSSTGYLSELSLLRGQLQNLEERKTELEQQLTTSCEDLESMRVELERSKQLVADSQAQLDELQSIKERLLNEEAMKTEVQKKLEESQVEVSKLQASIATLTLELADQKALHGGVVAKCQEFERKLEGLGFDSYNDERNGYNLPEGECVGSKKEQELLAAKTQLAECQRTILALGKQLSTLSTSPPIDHSSLLSSCDGTGSSSMDSASQQLERRSIHMDTNTQSMGFMEEEDEQEEEEEEEDHHVHSHHQHDHNYHHNGGMYCNGGGRVVMVPQSHHYQHRGGGQCIQMERQLYEDNQIVVHRGRHNGGTNGSKGMINSNNEYSSANSNGQVDMYQSNNSRVVVQRRGPLQPVESYNDPSAEYMNNHDGNTNGSSYYDEVRVLEGASEYHHHHHHHHQLPHHQRQALNMGGYSGNNMMTSVDGSHYTSSNNTHQSRSGSPTARMRGHAMTMSPARSPGRFTQQQRDALRGHLTPAEAVPTTRKRCGPGGGGVGRSLAEPMSAAVLVSEGRAGLLKTGPAAHSGSGSAFGRLFSRSKHHNRETEQN